MDALVDVVADRSDLVERPAGGVGELPVDVALARDEWAFVAAAHGDHDIGLGRELLGEPLRGAVGEVDAELAHDLDDFRMDVRGGVCPAESARWRPRRRARRGPGHLGAAGVVAADEKDVAHAAMYSIDRSSVQSISVDRWPSIWSWLPRPSGPPASHAASRRLPDVEREQADADGRVAKALGDPVRIQLVDVLRKHAGKVCVCELVPLFDISQPTLSHHLKMLREAGIVESERRGLWAYYYVLPDALEELSAWLS